MFVSSAFFFFLNNLGDQLVSLALSVEEKLNKAQGVNLIGSLEVTNTRLMNITHRS